jgi:hypothetical protein
MLVANVADLTASYEGQETTTLLQDLNLGQLEPSASTEKTINIRALYPGSKLIDFSLQASLSDLNASDGEEIQQVEEINHTASLDVVDPFELSSEVVYRHASRAVGEDGVEGWATVMSVVSMPEAGSRSVAVRKIEVEPKVSHMPRVTMWSIADEQSETIQLLTSSLAQQGANSFPQGKQSDNDRGFGSSRRLVRFYPVLHHQ